MMRDQRNCVSPAVLLLLVAVSACEVHPTNDNESLDAAWTHPCVAEEDEDGDGISNGDEGCMYGEEGTDTDGDEVPDYRDEDSDNDGIPDRVENGGSPLRPRDTDSDGIPDFRDLDSDDDGLADGEEDRNGDGLIGECLETCDGQDPRCGPGQACWVALGQCAPPVTFSCAGGETDPYHADTDGDGTLDPDEGTVVCFDRSENGRGRRPPIKVKRTASFSVALPQRALWQEVTVSNASGEPAERCDNGQDDDQDGQVDCDDRNCRTTTACGAVSAVLDLPEEQDSVAGFVTSRRIPFDAALGSSRVINALVPARFTASQAYVISSGTATTSHDGMPSRAYTSIAISGIERTSIYDLRNEILRAILEKTSEETSVLPDGATYAESNEDEPHASGTSFRVRYVIQKRALVSATVEVIAASVALTSHVQDGYRRTSIMQSDLSNLTNLAGRTAELGSACEGLTTTTRSKADIIWVVDESGSMEEERENVATHALDFFTQATSFGLDFRMGVVNVHYYNDGRLCTGQNESADHFLLPSEQQSFEECIRYPWGSDTQEGGNEYGIEQGYNALVRHLPMEPWIDRLRPDAEHALIYLSDEMDQAFEYACCPCGFDATNIDYIVPDESCYQPVVQPTIDLLTGVSVPGFRATAHAVVWPRGQLCLTATEVGRGYLDIVEAVGGRIGSVCQETLPEAIQKILLDIVGASSPLELSNVPISLSLAFSLNGEVVKRRRVNGFDYHAPGNSIILHDVWGHPPGTTSEVLIGYRTWVGGGTTE
jgi:hypothetical protein